MRYVSLVVCLAGISVLFLSLFSEARTFSSFDNHVLNDKVFLAGVVSEEWKRGTLLFMSLNNVTLVCDCTGSFLKKNVSVIGTIEEYKGEKEIRVLKIRE